MNDRRVPELPKFATGWQIGQPDVVFQMLAPGTSPQVFPAGTALRLAPGGTLHLELHYKATGVAGTDVGVRPGASR